MDTFPQHKTARIEASTAMVWVAAFAIVVVVALLFLQAPHGGAFYWSDAPRHALNGVFVKDLLLDLPLDDPAGYAYRYYAQYPALTILFYPPLFYAISAPFYALLGVSHEAALFVVFLHYAAYGLGCFALARFWLSAVPALAFALLMVLLPRPLQPRAADLPDNHLAYAGQWFGLAIALAAIYGLYLRRRPVAPAAKPE